MIPNADDMKCTACGGTGGVELIRLKDGTCRECFRCSLIPDPLAVMTPWVDKGDHLKFLARKPGG